MYWKNRVVIITGSSRGIGWELANQLLISGANVVINARNEEVLELKLREIQNKGYDALAVPGDVSNYNDCAEIVKQTINRFGKLDVLINNAGLSAEAIAFDSIGIHVFQKLVDVNFTGSVNMTKAALPLLKQSEGRILFICSLAGLHGFGNYAAYCSSKMALTAFAESLKIELKNQKVAVSIAYVGFTQNDSEKTVADKDGNLTPQKKNVKVKPQPVHQVAKLLMKMVEKKTFKKVFSGKGLLLLFMTRFFPALLRSILVRLFEKETKNQR